jgi:hypothetical protein
MRKKVRPAPAAGGLGGGPTAGSLRASESIKPPDAPGVKIVRRFLADSRRAAQVLVDLFFGGEGVGQR